MNEKFHFFWNGPFSQWHTSKFEVNGIEYNTCEQFMMAEKARLFKDEKALTAIMYTNDPGSQKAVGRKVQNFDATAWNEVCRLVVYRGNLAKFTQNAVLYDWLMDTGNKIIVEASPYDRIWGIGRHQDEKKAWDHGR